MLLLVAASLAMRAGLNAREAWWVAVLIATMPAVHSGSVGCFVDGIYAAFILAAIRVGADAETISDWAIFGVFAGLGMGTKYTGILALPALVSFAVWIRSRSGPDLWRATVKHAMVAISIAFMVAAPYYLRNWILLGCPIYPPPPGFTRFCSPKYLSLEAVSQFHVYIRERGAGLGRGLIPFLLLPFNLTYHTSNFHGAGGIGLAPLAFAPIGLLASWNDRFAKSLAALGLLLLVAWFVTQQESRFLIHVYILATIFSVLGWRLAVSTGSQLTRILAVSIVFTSLSYGTFMIAKAWPNALHSVLSPEYAEAQRAGNVPFLQSFQYLNKSPDVTRVLILDPSVPPFYSDKDYIKPLGQWGEQTLPGSISPLEAVQKVHELGVSHVLDVNSEVAPFRIVGPRKGLTLVLEARNQRIYRVD
jgi:hypothetical protein